MLHAVLRRRYVRITYSLIILEADCLIVIQELARINDGVTWEIKDGPSATLSNKTQRLAGRNASCLLHEVETISTRF